MACVQYCFVIFLMVSTRGSNGYNICGRDSSISKMPPCGYDHAIYCGEYGTYKHQKCKTIQPFSVSSRLTYNITCIDKDQQHPTNGYLLAGCEGIITTSKESSTKGVCTMQVRSNEQEMVTSNVHLSIKHLTNRKYKFNCHHKDGTVISTEAIVFSALNQLQELIILVNGKPQPPPATNIMEGDSVSIIFRKFGGYDVYGSPDCFQLAANAKKRIYCDLVYPCSKISRSQTGETPAIVILYSFIPVTMRENGITITFTDNNNAYIDAFTITVKRRPQDQYLASSCFSYPQIFQTN